MISDFRTESLKTTYESLMKVVGFEWDFLTDENKPITVECVCQAVKFDGTNVVYCIFFSNPSSQNEELTNLRKKFFSKTGKNRIQRVSISRKHSSIRNKNPENLNKKMIKIHSEHMNFRHTNSKKDKKTTNHQSEMKERKKEENEKEKEKDKEKKKDKKKDREDEKSKEKKTKTEKNKKNKNPDLNNVIDKNIKEIETFKTDQERVNEKDMYSSEIETAKTTETETTDNMDFVIGLELNDLQIDDDENGNGFINDDDDDDDDDDEDYDDDEDDDDDDDDDDDGDESDGILFSDLNDPKKACQNIFTNILQKIDNENDQKLKQEILYHSKNMIQLFDILDQKIMEKKKELKKKEIKCKQKNRTQSDKLEKKIQKILKKTIELPDLEKENEKMISKIDQLKKILKQQQKISQQIENEYHEN
ncbi:u3 small nucleolar ribonucleoprotein mpp10 [Anaeramoeba flamelloides]|uniref:U3 small nucleolar ribonucleoprotein mpp10 n=1 Tax=Anaeramoeba flamelloides TaxID=1746091 RepID=A0ABQ8YA22_9EUKA|nr:u3 small nucleolar ribonucleoprotein mpp10 [Anaeramoeba flamelloides]